MPKRTTTKKKNAGGAQNSKRATPAGEAVIQPDSEEEVYGVLLSEHRRMGEDPQTVPKTGIAKTRKIT